MYNHEVHFTGPFFNGQGPAIEIGASDLTPIMFVDFDPAIGEHPILVAGGGFCLIDNISGPFPPGENIYNTPYLRIDPHSFKHEVWIPTAMTSPI
ncbi:MAG: hypothetical protein AAF570_23810, partial [Bacteroidota bacterium]